MRLMFTVLAILRNLHVDVADDRILIFKIIARNVTNGNPWRNSIVIMVIIVI